MNSNIFKNADIDRKNEEMNTEYSCGNCGHQFKSEEDWAGNCDEHSCCYCECDCSDCASLDCDDEPTLDCARCGRRGLTEEQVCIREWEGDSDAPMCAPCWDETEEEENALEEEGEEGLKNLHNIRRNMFGFASTAEQVKSARMEDEVSAEVVEDERELLVCPYCERNEKECEEQTEAEKNPITDWCGGWGLSCDDCYYKNHPESDDEEVFGKCDGCGFEGKFFGKEGDDWTCSACLYGGGDSEDE